MCGCGQVVVSKSNRKANIEKARFCLGHKRSGLTPYKQQPPKPCACGCGKLVIFHGKNKHIRFIHGHNGRGALHYDYKGGRYVNDSGYVMVLRPDHPRAMSNGYVREHILVMEAWLGRSLKPNETIHHKNGNRQDNRIQNLERFDSHADHMAEHYGTANLGPQICSKCGSDKTLKRGRGKGYRWYINKQKTGWLCNTCYNHIRLGKVSE